MKQYFLPSSLGEAISILAEGEGKAKVLAGGTDLLPLIVDRQFQPEVLVSLRRIKELQVIQNEEKSVILGAAARLQDVEKFLLSQQTLPILSSAIGEMGSWQVRNRGTIGGNICNASPAADTAAPLLVLDSEVVAEGPEGKHRIPLSEFFIGPGKTVLKHNEILTNILIPKAPRGEGTYIKLGRRRAMEIAIVGVAVWVFPDGSSGRIKKIRIALSSVSPIPFRAVEAEKRLEGEIVDERAIVDAGDIASRLSNPISDVRATREYRREMVRVLTRRAILEALGRAIGGRL